LLGWKAKDLLFVGEKAIYASYGSATVSTLEASDCSSLLLACVQIAYKYVPTAACQMANARRGEGGGGLFRFDKNDHNQGTNDNPLKQPIAPR
jgi:hypothetical protein